MKICNKIHLDIVQIFKRSGGIHFILFFLSVNSTVILKGQLPPFFL